MKYFASLLDNRKLWVAIPHEDGLPVDGTPDYDAPTPPHCRGCKQPVEGKPWVSVEPGGPYWCFPCWREELARHPTVEALSFSTQEVEAFRQIAKAFNTFHASFLDRLLRAFRVAQTVQYLDVYSQEIKAAEDSAADEPTIIQGGKDVVGP